MATTQEISDWLNAAFSTDAFHVAGDGNTLLVTHGPLPPHSTPEPSIALSRVSGTGSTLAATMVINNIPTSLTAQPGMPVMLFGGFTIFITSFMLTITDGQASTRSSETKITGQLALPLFFLHAGKTEVIDVELIPLRGALTTFDCVLAATQSNPARLSPDGSVKASITMDPPASDSLLKNFAFDLNIRHLSCPKLPKTGTHFMLVDAKFFLRAQPRDSTTPIDLPSLDLKGLGMDSHGDLHLDRGWLKLPKHAGINLTGFKFFVKELGFGYDKDGLSKHPWIGFTAKITVGTGISIGGEVKRFRINLDTGQVSIQGIGVDTEVQHVLKLKGDIDFLHAVNQEEFSNRESDLPLPDQTRVPSIYPISLLSGTIDLQFEVLRDLGISATFLNGYLGGMGLVFIDLRVKFGLGVPIFLNLSLYALEGLFSADLRPDPTLPDPDGHTHTWWEWYRYPTDDSGRIQVGGIANNTNDGTPIPNTETANQLAHPDQHNADSDADDDDTPGWYSAISVNKWLFPNKGAFAFGAGAYIGTTVDTGFTVNGGLMLVVLFPGPVIMLIGKADILKKMSNNTKREALFTALAVLDFSAGTFDLAIDAQYKIPLTLDIRGTAELFIDTVRGTWYLAIGKPARSLRVSAKLLEVFDANAYFVVSDTGLVTGAYIGFGKSWDFGPLSVGFNAFIAAMLAINWSPLQAGGGLRLHGDAHMTVFGFGFAVGVDALLEGCAPNPWWVHGELGVELDLPWPLPSFSATLPLSWGGDDGSVPPAPLALNHIDATVSDHAGANDHYTLLAHHNGAAPADPAVQYDPDVSGLLSMDAANEAHLATRLASAMDPLDILPDVTPGPIPGAAGNANFAPVVPMDARFTFAFAHSVHDITGSGVAPDPHRAFDTPGFQNAADFATVQPDVEPPQPPNSDPNMIDTVAGINLNPPKPSFEFRHTLRQVALYAFEFGDWHLVASKPPRAPGSTTLQGEWVTATDPNDNHGPNTLLKIAPETHRRSDSFHSLPLGHTLYAIKCLTQIEARRVSDITAEFAVVHDGDAVVEFAYFQTASGPGISTMGPGGSSSPSPEADPPYPELAAAAGPPSSNFPIGGSLSDLRTYEQWSWPAQQAPAAYYGYDLNVEFDEDAVPAFYATAAGGDPFNALHLRCRDMNHNHIYIANRSIHVPSVPQQSAVVGGVLVPVLPRVVQSRLSPVSAPIVSPAVRASLDRAAIQSAKAAIQSAGGRFTATPPGAIQPATPEATAPTLDRPGRLQSLADRPVLHGRALHIVQQFAQSVSPGISPALLSDLVTLDPGLRGAILWYILEEEAAQQVRALWWQPLRPQTRYTLDVVVGPQDDPAAELKSVVKGGIDGIQRATTAQAALAALQRYLAHDDGLTSLHQVSFVTSRYATFAEHLAVAVAQSNGATTPPLLNFDISVQGEAALAPSVSALGAAQSAYLHDRDDLAAFLTTFDSGSQQATLLAKRKQVESSWQAYHATVATAFDSVITALGRADLVSSAQVQPPPETELRLFTDGRTVQALLIESVEPLDMRRVWQWTTLTPVGRATRLTGHTVLWCRDMTRVLILPQGVRRGSYTLAMTFQGNIGAEVPAITTGQAVTDLVTFGPIQLGPARQIRPIVPPVHGLHG